jgi:hypothetical protein
VQGESGLSKSWILPNTEGTESETTGWLVASACPVLHLPAHWPWAEQWIALWTKMFDPTTGPPIAA